MSPATIRGWRHKVNGETKAPGEKAPLKAYMKEEYMVYKWRSKPDLDAAVLVYLSDPSKCNGGAARSAIADGINESEGSVNASLRRLKAGGRVVFDGPRRIWRVT